MRYAVFLRGVSPQNLGMPTFAAALAAAGGSGVRTLLSSGNAVFEARASARAALERKIEKSLEVCAGRRFSAFVRSATDLERIVSRCDYRSHAGTKRVVVLCRGDARTDGEIPFERPSWALLSVSDTEAYGFYTPGPQASSLMSHLKRLYGNEFTTRTAETLRKCTGGQ